VLVDVGSELCVFSVLEAVTEIDLVSDLESVASADSVFFSEASAVLVVLPCWRVNVEADSIDLVFC
jgi:hypothetical protein